MSDACAPLRLSRQICGAAAVLVFLLMTLVASRASAEVGSAARPFVHPGLLHGADDVRLVRRMVAERREPWWSGFQRLARHEQSSAEWRLRGPRTVVARAPGASKNNPEMVSDANAAYQNALMWAITGNEAHARKSVEILNAWGGRLEEMRGRDVQLAAGLNGFQLVNAAELMRWTYDGWRDEDVARFEEMLLGVVYPPIKDFATFANGNWDAACIKTMMAIGVFCDNRKVFDRAVDYYHNGSGNGRLTHYVINEQGQCQESGRDQQHVQLGLGCLAEACEVGYRQGVDMYGAADNRLLRGFEYTAAYLLGARVPFEEHVDTTGKYHHLEISPRGRDRFRPVYEMVLNHYRNRRGVDAPYTARAAQRVRPEGAAYGADHPGFGTLMFYRDPAARDARPDA